MRMKTFLAYGVLCGLLTATCSKDPSGPNETVPLIPLSVGNQWVYQISAYDTSGHLDSTWVDTVEVVQDTVITGERWYRAESTEGGVFLLLYRGGAGRERWLAPLLANRQDGLWIRGTGMYYMPPAMMLYYPASVGTEFRDFDGLEVRVEALGVDTTVLGRRYRCVQYHTAETEFSFRTQMFVHPGIGPIRTEIYGETEGGRLYLWRLLELESSEFA